MLGRERMMDSESRLSVMVVVCGVIVALGSLAHAQYGGGSGEPNDPYLIYTPEQLQAIGADPNHWSKQFKLMADLDLTAYPGDEFNIIGREIVKVTARTRTRGLAAVIIERTLIPFTGTFDGGGHTISNFTYTCRDGNKIGLFGYVADPNARICDLGLIDPRIVAQGGEEIGCLVGRIDDGAVVNCHIRLGRILADTVSHVGALVGHIQGGTLADCGSVVSFVLCQGGTSVGTLAGYLREGTLRRCYADDSLVLGEDSVGGLLGTNGGGTVEDCRAVSTVTGGEFVGGLIGTNTGAVMSSEANSDVWGSRWVGGLVGESNTPRKGRGAEGVVLVTIDDSHSSGVVVGEEYVGGLVGLHWAGTISACHARGLVGGDESVGGLVGLSRTASIITVSYATASVTGDEAAGGLVGSNEGTVATCYASGDVAGVDCLGGLVGGDEGAIASCYATGSVSGLQRIGGLVGYHEEGALTNSYSVGSVTGEWLIGGLVGHELMSAIHACFWDVEASGQIDGKGGTGSTTAEMMRAETFLEAGWDFVGEVENGTDDIWWIWEGRDYPRLWWELADEDATEALQDKRRAGGGAGQGAISLRGERGESIPVGIVGAEAVGARDGEAGCWRGFAGLAEAGRGVWLGNFI